MDAFIERARRGDPDAFGPVVAAFQARLRAFLAGYVPRWDWVDDLAQQTFISAYRSLRSYESGTDFYRWLRAIAYNHLKAELERAARRRRLDEESLPRRTAEELGRRLEREDGDRVEALRDCLDRLPEGSRTLIDRRYRDGTSLPDIARALGRSVDGLKVAFFRIRAQLRECVERKHAASGTETP